MVLDMDGFGWRWQNMNDTLVPSGLYWAGVPLVVIPRYKTRRERDGQAHIQFVMS